MDCPFCRIKMMESGEWAEHKVHKCEDCEYTYDTGDPVSIDWHRHVTRPKPVNAPNVPLATSETRV